MPTSITPTQRRKFSKIGNTLIKDDLTTGFQIEDYNPKTNNKPRIIYGHDNPEHLRNVRNKTGGTIHPRESFYRWNNSWTAGKNTELLFNRTLAKANEEYLESERIKKAGRYISSNTVKGRGTSVKNSWTVPDVRLYGGATQEGFADAFLVTKRIDDNSRLSTIVKSPTKVKKIRKKLKYERVKKIKVQRYRPKKHSFFDFIR